MVRLVEPNVTPDASGPLAAWILPWSGVSVIQLLCRHPSWESKGENACRQKESPELVLMNSCSELRSPRTPEPASYRHIVGISHRSHQAFQASADLVPPLVARASLLIVSSPSLVSQGGV